MLRKLTVRDAEKISRKIAIEKVRKVNLLPDAELLEIEHEIGTVLGTRVNIAKKEEGGRIQIDFFSQEDLDAIVALLLKRNAISSQNQISNQQSEVTPPSNPNTTQTSIPAVDPLDLPAHATPESNSTLVEAPTQIESQGEDKFADQQITIDTPNYGDEDDEDLYSMKGFSL